MKLTLLVALVLAGCGAGGIESETDCDVLAGFAAGQETHIRQTAALRLRASDETHELLATARDRMTDLGCAS